MRVKLGIVFVLLLQAAFWGCDSDSGVDTPGNGAKRKLWSLPLPTDSIPLPSDSLAFSFKGTEIDVFLLWNGCFTFVGTDSIRDAFGNETHFDSIPSASADTLVRTSQGLIEPKRYLELENRCVDNTPIATVNLEAGGFEDKVYADSDSVRFRFSFSIRPDKKPHDFQFYLYGQIDYSNGRSFNLTHSISGLSGVFDTTLSVGDLIKQWKGSDARYIRYGIGYFRSERVSIWVNSSGEKRVISRFE